MLRRELGTRFLLLPLFLVVSLGADAAPPAAAEVVVTNSTELRSALNAAGPGSRIAVAPGRYGSVFATKIAGTAEQPIVVTAKDPNDPPLFEAGIHLSAVAHLEIRNLVVAGAPKNGINVDDAGSLETPSHHLTFDRVTVKDVGGEANADGIKLSGVDDCVISNCTIERWGRGGSGIDLVGCHRVRIESTTLRDSEASPAASGIQAKGGSADVVIRRCVFEHAGQRAVNLGGSTGLPYFRPRNPGYEAKNVVVEGNLFTGSHAPIACVGCDGASIRFNTIRQPTKWALRILQESRGEEFAPCRNGSFTDNLVVYDGRRCFDLVNVGPGTAPETFVFARNYWYRVDAPGRSVPRLPTTEIEPRGGEDPQLVDPSSFEVAEASPAREVGAAAWK